MAQFCFSKGVQTLHELKQKPETRAVMPFLYDDDPQFPEFLRVLREISGMAAAKR